VIKSAVISECTRYRYRLYREWEKSHLLPLLWVMLNPSTADGETDDRTISKCIAFAKLWGYGAMWVVNRYAYRSTDPSVLKLLSVTEAEGPENDWHLGVIGSQCASAVLAWGNPGGTHIPESLWCPGGNFCLGVTKVGAPKHPLYLPMTTQRVLYPIVRKVA